MVRKSALFVVLIGVIVGIAMLYTYGMRYLGSGKAPEMADTAQRATHIVVDKSDRRLTFYRESEEILDVPVSLGDAPVGHKVKEGDERAPVGTYEID